MFDKTSENIYTYCRSYSGSDTQPRAPELFNLFAFPSSSRGRNAPTRHRSENFTSPGQVKSKNKLEKAAVEMRYILTDPFRLYCRTWPFAVKRNILEIQYIIYTRM